MLYAALGDSITYGYSASSEEARYVTRIQRSFAKQRVNTFVLAKPGWTSKQLLRALPSVPSCIWSEARLVTIMVGGNDLLHAVPWMLDFSPSRALAVADKYHNNLAQIVETVNRPQSTVVVSTIYNPFPNWNVAAICIEAINDAIRAVASRERLVLADVARVFHRREAEWIEGFTKGRLRDFRIRGNPIHPNDSGHEAIAKAVLQAYRRSLSTGRTVRQKTR